MLDILEVKYLSVTWSDKDNVKKLNESNDSISIQYHDDGHHFIETTAFPKVYHYVGFHIINGSLNNISPYFELSNGEREELTAIKSPGDGKLWWIQNSGWDKSNKRFYSEIFRSVGTIYLVVKSKKLTIINNYIDFSVDDLNYYLQDFKNDLWMLILDNSNPVKGSIEGTTPNFFQEDTLHLYSEFIKISKKVIESPNMFLSERQSQIPRKKAKPVSLTFRELAINPKRRVVTSRDFYESYDTAENRYINFCAQRLVFFLRTFDRLSSQRTSSYKKKIEQDLEVKRNLKNKKTITISNKVVQSEIKTIQEQVDRLKKSKVNKDPTLFTEKQIIDLNYNGFEFGLGKIYRKKINCYFIQTVNGYDLKEYLNLNNLSDFTYAVIEFDISNEFDIRKSDLSYMTIQVSGFFTQDPKKNSKSKAYIALYFKHITRLDFDIKEHRLYQNLVSRKSKLSNMRGTNLERPLTHSEKNEINEECEVLDKKIEMMKKTSIEVKEFSSHLPYYISQINEIVGFFKKYRVGVSHTCPNSMVFIQNPNYAGSKSLFKKIVELNNLNLSLLEDMMMIDEIGLTNISNLYERWCLIKVIKVLNEIYGFSLMDGWQKSLISSILKNKYNACVSMHSDKTRQNLNVFYEKEISITKENDEGFQQASNIRPDIVIDLKSKKFEVEYSRKHKRSRLKESNVEYRRLVLDAKFKDLDEFAHHALVKSLYFGKNYSEHGRNQVFIIHPTPSVIESPTSPLEWGMYCDYGQTGNLENTDKVGESSRIGVDDTSVNHKFGGIFLSPSLDYHSSIDNLQRLMGMFLQQNSQRYFCTRTEDKWHTMVCISCGNTNRKLLNLSYDKTKGDNDKWELRCESCKQLSVQTVCVKCGYEIFKNGMKWTYHRTRAEQFTNVVCPKCESFL